MHPGKPNLTMYWHWRFAGLISSSVDKPIRPLSNATSHYYMSSLPNEAVYDMEKNGVTWPEQLNALLETVDSEIADIIEHKKAK